MKTLILLAVIWTAIESEILDFYSLPEDIQALLTQYSPEFIKTAINAITISPEDEFFIKIVNFTAD